VKKPAVDVYCGARGGRCRRGLVARLWWTPEPELLQLNTSDIGVSHVPRDIRGTAMMGCPYHDGNKGQRLIDLRQLLGEAFAKYEDTRKIQEVTLPR
jgi:hypothetical protein